MPTQPFRVFTNRGVRPIIREDLAVEKVGRLPASVSYSRGQVLAELFGTDEVQTITITGEPTGGTFTLSFGGSTTTALAYNATPAQIQAALLAIAPIGNSAVQTVTLGGNPTGGIFTLGYDGVATGNIAYNATSTVVQAALEAISSIGAGNVVVSGSAGGPYTLTFQGYMANKPIAALGATAFGLVPTTATVTVAVVNPGGGATNNLAVSAQRSKYLLTLAPGTDGGAFALRITRAGYDPQTIASQAWNVSAANLDTAIEGLSSIGTAGVVTTLAGEVYTLVFANSLGDINVEVVNDTTNDGGVAEGGIVVTEGGAGGPYVVTFQNRFGETNVAAITADATLLTGGSSPGVTIATPTAGSAGTVGTWTAYDPTAVNGAQIAKGILVYDSTTDANGYITTGQVSTGAAISGAKSLTAPILVAGYVDTRECVGLTEEAVAQLGRIVQGSLSAGGILKIN